MSALNHHLPHLSHLSLRAIRGVVPALLVAATLMALPAVANAAPQQQWGPVFHGNYVTLAVGVGEFSSCNVDSRIDDYIRAFNTSIRYGKQIASLKADTWMTQDFERGRWYAMFAWEPGCSRPQWVAVRQGTDHIDVMVNGGAMVCVREGSSYCRDIVVERTACDIHIISLHVKAICEHEFGYRLTTRCEHIEQPRPRPTPRTQPAPRPAPPVVVVPGHRGGETRFPESRRDSRDDRSSHDNRRDDRRADDRRDTDNRRDSSRDNRDSSRDHRSSNRRGR